MGADVASAAISAAIALIVAFPLGGALKRHPAPFYAVALAAGIAYLWYRFSGSYVRSAVIATDIMQKGYLACMFLAVVMFIGVLDGTSPIRRKLQLIRAELSILSFILILSHVAGYLPSYLPVLGRIFSTNTQMAASVVMAGVLTLIFALLAVLSLHVVRSKMPFKAWKAVQRLAYLMVVLLYLHILLALGRSAFVGHGSAGAMAALAVYSAIFLVYAVLRIRKAVRDRRGNA